jgi:hypothetical protein
VFLICIVLIIFFSFYITIVVQLYGTVHGKNNQLYIYFFRFWFLCLLVGIFNLYNTSYFFSFYITIVIHLYGTAHGKNNQLYNFFCFWFCVYSIYQHCFYY